MKKTYFIIGDIHGEADMMEEMLQNWDEETQQLVFMGDLIDRGPDNKRSVLTGMKYAKEKNAWYLMGNHEVMFLAFIDDPEGRFPHYFRNNGDTTINDLLGRPQGTPVNPVEDAEAIKAQYPELIAFLRERPLFIDEGDLLLAHAGVDLRLDDWHDTEPKDFYWIREPFHKGANNTGKTIIFGHTPLRGLNEDGDFMKLWQHDGKIGMKKNAVLLWVVYFLNLMVFPAFFIRYTSSGPSVDTNAYLILQLVSTAIGVALFREKLVEGFKNFIKRPFIRDLAIGYALRIGLAIAVAQFIGDVTSDNQEQIEKMMSANDAVLMFVLLCVVAPILEELVFREAIIGSFKKSLNVHVLTFISAFLFVLLHALSKDAAGLIDWTAALMYVPLTIPIVGMYRYYNDNVFASISMHFLNNFIAFLFLLNQ